MEPLGLLVGVENGAATWKTVWAPQKVPHRTATRSCFSTSGYLARELKTNRSLYQNVPAYDSRQPEVEATHVYRQTMDKQNGHTDQGTQYAA